MSYRRSESVLLNVVQEPVLSRQETSNSVVDCFLIVNIVGQLSGVECLQMTRVCLLPLHACTVPIYLLCDCSFLFTFFNEQCVL